MLFTHTYLRYESISKALPPVSALCFLAPNRSQLAVTCGAEQITIPTRCDVPFAAPSDNDTQITTAHSCNCKIGGVEVQIEGAGNCFYLNVSMSVGRV